MVNDRIFARRVYLDTIGLLPPPEELETFVASQQSGQAGRRWSRMALARNDAYAQNWLTFWNDLLRNDYSGTGYIDGGREQITQWLYSALLTNMPYDRFVAQLSQSEQAGGRIHQGNCLAGRRQRQPDAADASGAKYVAGVHGRESQMRFLPRQFYQ